MFQCYRTYIKTYRNEKKILIAISALLILILYIFIVLITLVNKSMVGREAVFTFERWVSVAIPTICGAYNIYRAMTTKELETLLFYPLKVSSFLLIYVLECQILLVLINMVLFIIGAVYNEKCSGIFINWISGSIASICVPFILAIIMIMPDIIAKYIWGLKKLLFIAWTVICIKIGLMIAARQDSGDIRYAMVYLGLCMLSYFVIKAQGNEFVAKIWSIDKVESVRRDNIHLRNESIIFTLSSITRIRKIESEIALTYIKSIFDIVVLSIIYSRYRFCDLRIWIRLLLILNIFLSTFSYKIFSMDRDYILIKDYYPIDKSEIIRKYMGAIIIQSPYMVISNIVFTIIYKDILDIGIVVGTCVLFLLINILGVVIDYNNLDTRLKIKDTDRGEMNKIILLVIVGVTCAGVGVI